MVRTASARRTEQSPPLGGGSSVSVREICLLAAARPSQGWAAGECVTWSGRVYRVEATQDPPESPPAHSPGLDPDDTPGYVHLTPLPAAPA